MRSASGHLRRRGQGGKGKPDWTFLKASWSITNDQDQDQDQSPIQIGIGPRESEMTCEPAGRGKGVTRSWSPWRLGRSLPWWEEH